MLRSAVTVHAAGPRADKLVLRDKTVARHLSNIFVALNVPVPHRHAAYTRDHDERPANSAWSVAVERLLHGRRRAVSLDATSKSTTWLLQATAL